MQQPQPQTRHVRTSSSASTRTIPNVERRASSATAADPNIHYTTIIRLPFPRGDFLDPPAVEWDAVKDRALWSIISQAANSKELDWHELSEGFHVSLPFLLQQAAWLYERHFAQVRAQMKRVGVSSQAPSPKPGEMSGATAMAMKRMSSGGGMVGANSRAPSGLSVRTNRDATLPPREASSVSAPTTPMSGGAIAPPPPATISRTPSSKTITQSRHFVAQSGKVGGNRNSMGSGGVSRPGAEPLSTTAEDDGSETAAVVAGQEASVSPERKAVLSSSDGSSSDEEDDDDVRGSRLMRPLPNYRQLLGSKNHASRTHFPSDDEDEEDGEDDDDGPTFLPFAANAAAAATGTTTRQSPPKTEQKRSAEHQTTTTRRKPSDGPMSITSSTSSTSAGPVPTAPIVAAAATAQMPNPSPPKHLPTTTNPNPPSNVAPNTSPRTALSPRHRAYLSRLQNTGNDGAGAGAGAGVGPGISGGVGSPRALAALSLARGSRASDGTGTPSMGSSFSDLDGESLTRSALEDALAREMEGGGSAAGSVAGSLRMGMGLGSPFSNASGGARRG